MGAYRTDEGKPLILGCVRKAEEIMLQNNADHEYAPIDGSASYLKKCSILAFGENSDIVNNNRYAGCQSLSGTGALRVFFDFLKKYYPNKDAKVLIPNPTWANHMGITDAAGYDYQYYRYYNNANRGFDLKGMLEDLDKAPNE